MLWFTSDLHLGHRAVIEYAKRPYKSVDEMDEALIRNWNDCVQLGDSIYVVGDFSFHKWARTEEIFHRLNGQKFLVRGNHDQEDQLARLFAWVKDLYTIKVEVVVPTGHEKGVGELVITQRIVLCHYAMRVWDQSHRGAWMLHGHSHGTLPDDPNLLSLDVGVDCWDMRPVSFDQIRARMLLKAWKPVDHHGEDRE